jgi:oligoribonuclease NrnB/cAMP/cGMP phosphodiesterase (DHH superfamily)
MTTKVNPQKLCIYHHNCLDGFGAAWSVRHALAAAVEFYPGVHQQPPPDVTGREVILVDFSYDHEVLQAMLTTAASITILDHHVTAEKALSELLASGKIQGQFDMQRSGAMLAWLWFNPAQPVPKLIEYIQDRDLWTFKLDGSTEINAALASYPFEFPLWDSLMASNEQQLVALRQEGAAIERRLQKDIRQLIEAGVRRMHIAGFDVPALNAPAAYVSDAGHLLSLGEPFAACYWDHPGGRSFSLRSSEGGVDVAEVAEKYGGGGHAKAAGFTMPIGWEGD